MGAFDPIALEVMRVALDEAWRCVPESERTRHRHSDMAVRLLKAAGDGERDPKKLKEVALGKPDAMDFLAGVAKQVTAEIIGDDALQREGKQQAHHGSKRNEDPTQAETE